MNCGIFCVRKYFELISYDGSEIIRQLQSHVSNRGLSVLDIVDVMNRNGFECVAYYDRKVCYEFPYIMYDAVYHHYYLVADGDDRYVYIYDRNLGEMRLFRWFFRFIWSKYYVSVRRSVI
ncbi:MAG: hypothetical protein IJG59_09140 [Erysipelotrichaceae bacterium]|nr:hypothetical protein [Erysipelotrichaceae bacterium]